MSIEIIQYPEPIVDERGEETGDWTDKIGRCDCGAEVYLHGWICPCDCGREYNSAGQLLAPREQWGWETGEHPADVAAAETYSWGDE